MGEKTFKQNFKVSASLDICQEYMYILAVIYPTHIVNAQSTKHEFGLIGSVFQHFDVPQIF